MMYVLYNLFLALVSSLWLLPLGVATMYYRSAAYSELAIHEETVIRLMDGLFMLGFAWLWVSWVAWAYALIGRFRQGDPFTFDASKPLWKLHLLSFLSVFWIVIWWGYAVIFCGLKMQDSSREYIVCGAHKFYFISNGISWASFWLFIVLYRFNMAIIRRL